MKRLFRSLMALTAALILSLSFSSAVAFAAPADEQTTDGVVLDATMNGFTILTEQNGVLRFSTMDLDSSKVSGGIQLDHVIEVKYSGKISPNDASGAEVISVSQLSKEDGVKVISGYVLEGTGMSVLCLKGFSGEEYSLLVEDADKSASKGMIVDSVVDVHYKGEIKGSDTTGAEVIKVNAFGENKDIFLDAIKAAEAQTPADAKPTAERITVKQTESDILVDGEKVEFEAYLIEGYHYFAIRDIAAALSGSSKEFSVEYLDKSNSTNIVTGKPYEKIETKAHGAGDNSAISSGHRLVVDGNHVTVKAYTINGSDYFKLRDLSSCLGFSLGYDAETKEVRIITE